MDVVVVISCEDVPNSVITPGHSASEFIVTCDDGQVETYQCTNGVWTPQKPVCNHASNTDRGKYLIIHNGNS